MLCFDNLINYSNPFGDSCAVHDSPSQDGVGPTLIFVHICVLFKGARNRVDNFAQSYDLHVEVRVGCALAWPSPGI